MCPSTKPSEEGYQRKWCFHKCILVPLKTRTPSTNIKKGGLASKIIVTYILSVARRRSGDEEAVTLGDGAPVVEGVQHVHVGEVAEGLVETRLKVDQDQGHAGHEGREGHAGHEGHEEGGERPEVGEAAGGV